MPAAGEGRDGAAMTGPGQEVDARDLAALSEAELRAFIA